MNDRVHESRTSIHFGITFIFASNWTADKKKCVDFEKTLLDRKLEFGQTQIGARDFTLIRTEQSALQVKIASRGPQVSSLSISANNPQHQLDFFAKEADAICQACRQIWLADQVQLLECRAGIRHLYSFQEHAFKYLWETRLGQNPGDLRYLNKPVLGGGLRLVMPPTKQDTDPVQIEIRIESFLPDTVKLLAETVFAWPRPRLLAKTENFDPAARLESVEKYAVNEVWNFIERPQPDL